VGAAPGRYRRRLLLDGCKERMGVLWEDSDLGDPTFGKAEQLDDITRSGTAGRLRLPCLTAQLHHHVIALDQPDVLDAPVPIASEHLRHRCHPGRPVVASAVRQRTGLFDHKVRREQLEGAGPIAREKAFRELTNDPSVASHAQPPTLPVAPDSCSATLRRGAGERPRCPRGDQGASWYAPPGR